jgi:hypothetical protein
MTVIYIVVAKTIDMKKNTVIYSAQPENTRSLNVQETTKQSLSADTWSTYLSCSY